MMCEPRSSLLLHITFRGLVNPLVLLNTTQHHRHTSTTRAGTPVRRASMTHISHNVAQACKDALPSAVGDDRCDGLSGRIHKCVCLYGRKSTGTIHHIQKNILTGINQVRVIMAVYWVQGCATYICTAKPKAPPPPIPLSVDA